MAGIRKNTTVNIIMIMMCVMVIVITSAGENTKDVFLLYTDFKHRTVVTMSLDGYHRENCLPSGTFSVPSGITNDQNSNTVYILDEYIGVYKFTLDGQSSPELIYQNTSVRFNFLALDGKGHLFITDYRNGKITRINIDGTDPVDWVTGVDSSLGVVVDRKERYLIWSNYNAYTISRASLDVPMSNVNVIIQNTNHPTGLHIDTTLNKLFWCERFYGRVVMANTDGSDVEVIVDIDTNNMWDVTIYGGHLYITGSRNQDYKVYDIHNGLYTPILDTTTSNPFSITVVSGQMISADCSITCNNEGTVDNSTCTCDCYKHWVGEQCDICNVTCENGATVDENNCTCECLSQWRGERCEDCITDCENGGALDPNTCTCDCLPQWEGVKCDNCIRKCENGGTLDTNTCTCDCSQQWGGETCGSKISEKRSTLTHFTEEVTTNGARKTTDPILEPSENKNTFLEPSFMWPIIGAVAIVLIVAVTIIVIVVTVLRHKRAYSERETGTSASQAGNEMNDLTDTSPVQPNLDHKLQAQSTLDPEVMDIEPQYQDIEDKIGNSKAESEYMGTYEDTMANTYEKPDTAGREQYVDTAVYESLDEH